MEIWVAICPGANRPFGAWYSAPAAMAGIKASRITNFFDVRTETKDQITGHLRLKTGLETDITITRTTIKELVI